MVPNSIEEWINKNYPRPQIDPEWLQGCYDWVIAQNPNSNSTDPNIIHQIEIQLLESDLRDSMLHGTGIPHHFATDNAHANADTPHKHLTGPPVLVQIESITDVGISAHTLNKTRVIREERRDAGEIQDQEHGEEEEADDEIEGSGPIPKYPRSMLRLEISDGATTLRAMEYRPIPQLELGKTPLGCKLLLKNPKIRRGIVFLEPSNIVLKGHSITDREATQEDEFARGLRRRLGLPEPEPEPQEPEHGNELDQDGDAPMPPPPPRLPPPQQNARPHARNTRSPLRDISPPPSPTLLPHEDDEEQPRRRRVPNPNNARSHASAPASRSASESSTLVPSTPLTDSISSTSTSAIFASTSRASTSDDGQVLRSSLRLSPTPSSVRSRSVVSEVIDIESDDDEEASFGVGETSRPMKPIPTRARSRGSTSVSISSTTSKGTERGNLKDKSKDKDRDKEKKKGKEDKAESDYDEFDDDDMFLDDSFLDGISQAEREAERANGIGITLTSTASSIPSTISSIPSTISTRNATPNPILNASPVNETSSGSGSGSGSTSVITILDDDEEDKENTKVERRRVRARMGTGMGGAGPGMGGTGPGTRLEMGTGTGNAGVRKMDVDVVELSDSD